MRFTSRNTLSQIQLEALEAQLRSIAAGVKTGTISSFSSRFSKKTYSQRQLQTLVDCCKLTQSLWLLEQWSLAVGMQDSWRRLAGKLFGDDLLAIGPISHREMIRLLHTHRRLRLALGLRRAPDVSTLLKYAKRAARRDIVAPDGADA